MSVPVMNLNSSAPTWPGDPLLDEAFKSLPGFCFGVGDQLRHGMERAHRRHREQKLAARHKRDRLEVALNVIGQRHDQIPGDSERADRTHAQRVPIRRRFRGEIEPERERATGPIVDDDLLMQLVGQGGGKHARDRIGELPAACGTIMRIGWSGYSAAAGSANAQATKSRSN